MNRTLNTHFLFECLIHHSVHNSWNWDFYRQSELAESWDSFLQLACNDVRVFHIGYVFVERQYLSKHFEHQFKAELAWLQRCTYCFDILYQEFWGLLRISLEFIVAELESNITRELSQQIRIVEIPRSHHIKEHYNVCHVSFKSFFECKLLFFPCFDKLAMDFDRKISNLLGSRRVIILKQAD